MANAVGADVKFEGRSVDGVHTKYRMMKGTFLGSSRMLETVPMDVDVPESVCDVWMDHTRVHLDALRERSAQTPDCARDIQAGRNNGPRQRGLKTYE